MSEIILCCVCLVETDDMIGLFDKYVKNETFLWNVLFDVIGVDAYSLKDDMIPAASKICRPCSVRLIESYEFQKLCQKNWDKLILMTNGTLNFIVRLRSLTNDVQMFSFQNLSEKKK